MIFSPVIFVAFISVGQDIIHWPILIIKVIHAWDMLSLVLSILYLLAPYQCRAGFLCWRLSWALSAPDCSPKPSSASHLFSVPCSFPPVKQPQLLVLCLPLQTSSCLLFSCITWPSVCSSSPMAGEVHVGSTDPDSQELWPFLVIVCEKEWV